MKNVVTWLGIALIASSMLFLTACPSPTTISKLSNESDKYVNKDVTVVGRVQKGFGLSLPVAGMRGGVYKIDDGTGSIWVVTDRNVPSEGTRIGVTGRLQEGLNWNGKNYGLGIYEKDRRVK
jgi:hypothetical protein